MYHCIIKEIALHIPVIQLSFAILNLELVVNRLSTGCEAVTYISVHCFNLCSHTTPYVNNMKYAI